MRPIRIRQIASKVRNATPYHAFMLTYHLVVGGQKGKKKSCLTANRIGPLAEEFLVGINGYCNN